MRQFLILRIAGLALLCMACTAAFAQSFSADLVNTDDGKTKTDGKIYVDDNHMRMEGQGEQGRSGIVVMNYTTGVVDVIVPEQHMYMETKIGQGPAQRNLQLFRILDVENACPDWQRIQKENGETSTCRKVGDETLEGRSTVKYVGTSNGKTSTVWIDKSLKYPIQWQDENSKGELQNIHEGSQPATLFAIPPGYQKMDLGNMMRGQHH
jgi:hypothetical protein